MPYPNYNYYPQGYMPQAQQPMQIQNSTFINAPNEAYAYNYPVARGNCVSFKIEGQPIVIEKSMGFSNFENPKIERFRLIKEEVAQEPVQNGAESFQNNQPINLSDYALKSELDALRSEIEAFKEEIRNDTKSDYEHDKQNS